MPRHAASRRQKKHSTSLTWYVGVSVDKSQARLSNPLLLLCDQIHQRAKELGAGSVRHDQSVARWFSQHKVLPTKPAPADEAAAAAAPPSSETAPVEPELASVLAPLTADPAPGKPTPLSQEPKTKKEGQSKWWQRLAASLAAALQTVNAPYAALFPDHHPDEEDNKDGDDTGSNAPPSLLTELLHFGWVRTHWLVYILVVVNGLVRPSFLELIALLSLFLWATLSQPLPSHRFWTTLYVYTVGTFVLKYIFLFHFWGDFNAPAAPNGPCHESYMTTDCLTFARFFGIYRVDDGPHFQAELLPDMLLLMALAVHRLALETLGLWRYVEAKGRKKET